MAPSRAALALGDHLLLLLVGGAVAVGAHPGEVDAEFLGRAEELVVLLADLDLALLGDEVGVERQAWISLRSTLNDSGIDGSGMFSDLTIAS